MQTNVQSTPTPASRQQRNTLIIVLIIGAAVIAAGVLILVASNPFSVTPGNYAGVEQFRQSDGGFVLGDPDARVTVVEFADYACPACIAFLPDTERFIEDFVKTGQANFEFRVVPTAGGDLTAFLGEVAVCLDEQRPGAFWEAKDQFFQMGASGRYDGNSGRVVAQNLGLDYNAALACVNESDQVRTDVTLANRMGVQGTPAVMIRIDDGEPIWIDLGGQRLDRGAVPYPVLAEVVRANS